MTLPLFFFVDSFISFWHIISAILENPIWHFDLKYYHVVLTNNIDIPCTYYKVTAAHVFSFVALNSSSLSCFPLYSWSSPCFTLTDLLTESDNQ
ncbi:hypothetical protein A4A49_61052 [Nicotiana attenuata]|uniref:Uncharacterized protein n=1 Tax=Nicotiana attenuata TaxID=49451 RepID=A0A1J6KAG8_NICAT|nr:hypothetical protein A4A49_61052 [Nicotiana attenuata]